MQERVYHFFRNMNIYRRVYRSNLIVAAVSLVLLTAVFSSIYITQTLDRYRSVEDESLASYSDSITNSLYYLDDRIITISQNDRTQSLLSNYAAMSEYERYAAADEVTRLVVEQLHMIDSVTDVVMISRNHRTVQVYRGPHDDFSIDEFDYIGLANNSLSSNANTVIVNPQDYASSNRPVNRSGIVYLKRVTDTRNYFGIGYILVYLNKDKLFGITDAGSLEHRCVIEAGKAFIAGSMDQDGDLKEISRHIGKGESSFFAFLSGLGPLPALCSVRAIPVLNWHVVSAVSFRTILRGVALIVLSLLILILAISLIHAYVARSIAHSLDKPMRQILVTLHRVETGDFTQEPIESFRDELATIQESLNYTIQLLDHMFSTVRENEKDKYRLQLQALHAQMNPHFLMNALNSVTLLAELQGADNIRAFCKALSRLMQNMLRSDEFEAPLSAELGFLRDYTLIMQYRYFNRFQVSYDIEIPETTFVPRSVLQPLLENALQHGMDEKTVFLNIRLRAYRDGAALCISIEDDGCGIPAEKLPGLLPRDDASRSEITRGSSIGLKNIDQRLRLAYGAAYGLTVESEMGRFTRVTIRLPGQLKEGSRV